MYLDECSIARFPQTADDCDGGTTAAGQEGHMVDLSEGEAIFAIPAVPVWQETGLGDRGGGWRKGATTVASFHGPHCDCGRPFGITYDLDAIQECGVDPNETLLHELTHAWQYYLDPAGSEAEYVRQLQVYGYYYAPMECEAREMARRLTAAGVRVWFPNDQR